MPACSEELTKARCDEIVAVCAELYKSMSFKDITLKEIGRRTSFTRTSIYNYFQTKEEIFLELFKREYEAWTADLNALGRSHEGMTAREFAAALAETLERRGCLLKLMSMNLYDMEANSRTENLAAFKRAYGGSLEAMTRCLEKFFPDMSAQDIQGFIYCFYPFLFGVYPYTAVTPKQREAMALAGVRWPRLSVRTLVEDFTARLLG